MTRTIGVPRFGNAAIAALTLSLIGCAPALAAAAEPEENTPTFSKDIAPILFHNCATCHRAGEVAPFALLTYADAKKHSTEIAELTQNRQMPPWKASHGYGDFIGERRLTDQQIATIAAWANGGKPEGNSATKRTWPQ